MALQHNKNAQFLALLAYIGIFLGLAWSWPVLLILIWWRWTRIPALLYLLWIFVSDYGTLLLRGHTSKPAQKWGIWKCAAAYFPVKLVKTAELPPDRAYIICNAPHGIFSFSAVFNFCTHATGFENLYPGLDCRGVTLPWNFKLPFVRELCALWGAVDSKFDTLVKVLSRGSGSTLMLEVGGTLESLYCQKHTYNLVLNKRLGFVRVALRSGASLVPVIAFGETNTYDCDNPDPTKKGSNLLSHLQHLLMSVGGYTLPVFNGPYKLLSFMPYRAPITTVVGKPIDVPKFEGDFRSAEGKVLVDKYHAAFKQGLQQLWDEHKDTYAPDRKKELTFVE